MEGVLKQWLLNLVIDFPVSLSDLSKVLNHNDCEPSSLNVKPLLGFTFTQGAHGLAELARIGLITFSHRISQYESQPIRASELLRLVNQENAHRKLRNFCFKLTPAGGSAWESEAQPSWYDMEDGAGIPCYTNEGQSRGDLVGWDWTLFSQNREHLMATIGWWSMGVHARHEQIDLRTIELTLAAEYEVRYWKRLPNVYVVKFHSRVTAPVMTAWSGGHTPRWLIDWEIARHKWYRDPWEMAGWPPSR
jgi:hypothetical protein